MRLNSLKMSLLISEDFTRNAIKYPEKSAISTEVTKYIKKFEQKSPGLTDIAFTGTAADKRLEMVYLIKILWGVSLIRHEPKNKDLFSISIKQ